MQTQAIPEGTGKAGNALKRRDQIMRITTQATLRIHHLRQHDSRHITALLGRAAVDTRH